MVERVLILPDFKARDLIPRMAPQVPMGAENEAALLELRILRQKSTNADMEFYGWCAFFGFLILTWVFSRR